MNDNQHQYPLKYQDMEMCPGHEHTSTCPGCGAPGERRPKPPRWAYACGAYWNDASAWPHDVSVNTIMPNGDHVPRACTRNTSCSYIKKLHSIHGAFDNDV